MTDWLEIGALGRINDELDAPNVVAFGPLLRIRVLKELASWPELSIGRIARFALASADRSTFPITRKVASARS